MVSRGRIQNTNENLWRYINAGDWGAWLNCFAQDCRFTNLALTNTIRGKTDMWAPLRCKRC